MPDCASDDAVFDVHAASCPHATLKMLNPRLVPHPLPPPTQVLVPRALSDEEKRLLYDKGGKLEHLFSRSIWPSAIALGQTIVETPALGGFEWGVQTSIAIPCTIGAPV